MTLLLGKFLRMRSSTSRISMTGRWRGRYVYVSPKHEPSLHPGYGEFSMVLEQHWFGIFRGEFTDYELGNELQQGTVGGIIWRQQIWLKKRVPMFLIFSQGKYLPMSEYLENTFGKRPANWPHPAIVYRGAYDEAKRILTGHWKVHARIVPIPTGGVFRFEELSGMWEMKPVSE